MFKQGDALGDCPNCSAKDTVIYRGNDEGICKSCKSVFDVSLEDEANVPVEETKPVPEPIKVQPPPPVAKPIAPVQIAAPKQIGAQPIKPIGVQQTAPVAKKVEKSQPEAEPVSKLMAPAKVEIQNDKLEVKLVNNSKPSEASIIAAQLNLPDYILKSRPWRWAHEMSNIGNPYRSETKNWFIFDVIANSDGMTSSEIVAAIEPKFGDRISYLLTVYEVVNQCVSAGLLIMDPESRKVTLCKGSPRPTQLS